MTADQAIEILGPIRAWRAKTFVPELEDRKRRYWLDGRMTGLGPLLAAARDRRRRR